MTEKQAKEYWQKLQSYKPKNEIEKLLIDAYWDGFNQAHYSNVHPDLFPPKECEQAGLEYLQKLRIEGRINRALAGNGT